MAAPLFAASEKPKAADLVKDGQPIDLTSKKYKKLFNELRTKHNFSQKELDSIFSGLTIKRRVLVLMDSQWEAKPYYQYHPRFITPAVIKEGKEKLKEYKTIAENYKKHLKLSLLLLKVILFL